LSRQNYVEFGKADKAFYMKNTPQEDKKSFFFGFEDKKSFFFFWIFPDPIAFLPAAADTTGRVYDDFSRLLFLHAHRETSTLANEISEESGQFRFLRSGHYVNTVSLISFGVSK
jgi:hypothetical protein